MDKLLQTAYEEMYELIKSDYSSAVSAQCIVWEDDVPDRHPLLLHCSVPQEISGRFPDYNAGEIHNDKDKMLLFGMKGMLSAVSGKMQAVPSIRANMGCGIIPSLFPGIKPILFYDNRMPWIKNHLSKDEIKALREKDIKITDEFKLALEHMVYITEKIEGTGVYVYPLDLQGPVDTAHLVYGDEFFSDLYDDPELMHHLLDLSVYAINLSVDECLKIIPKSSEVLTHYSSLAMPRSKGGLKISEDTSTLLSPWLIDEFTIPYMNRVLEHAAGGYIHYCGKHDHLFKRILEQDLAFGINFGNPDMHYMDGISRTTAEAGKIYYGSIPMHPDETHPEYFKRVTTKATTNNKCRLLLELYVSHENRDQTELNWYKCFN